ncbi:unnamed protein product [Lactuca saligna]|uniref:Uncharacterized protein n=1 Tax=Lactuca saligna TaxID=75948 RepID=A0AA36E7I2_LACSI|nr:unnamed protein product [Lactuca saligna]
MKVDILKEIQELSANYSSLHSKIDTIVGVVMKVVEYYQSLISKDKAKASEDVLNFEKIGVLLGELREIVSKPTTTSDLTPEFLTQKFNSLEVEIMKVVAPLSKFENLLPTSAPPVVTGVQGGEKELVSCGFESHRWCQMLRYELGSPGLEVSNLDRRSGNGSVSELPMIYLAAITTKSLEFPQGLCPKSKLL